MHRSVVETIIGAVVLAVAGLFLYFTYSTGYQKVDASGAYLVHPRLRLYVSVENVLDQRYEAALGYPALPRAVRVGMTVTLGGDSAKRP